MGTHTPGPWIAQPDPHSNPGEWVIGVANGPVDYVAVCNERDARLIAAAPELLSELEAAPILSRYHTPSGFDLERFVTDYEDWSERKRAAITKTTRGES